MSANDPNGHQLDAGLGILEPLAAGLVLRQCQQIVGPASAQIGSQCGYTRDVPCYIMIIPSGAGLAISRRAVKSLSGTYSRKGGITTGL